MGLDTSHDCWHGPYSAFSRWRDRLSRAAGYWVERIGDNTVSSAVIDWGHTQEKNLVGEWDTAPADPLFYLIVHSDCDGVIHPQHGALLADRLEELLPLLEPDDEKFTGVRWQTRRFIEGLRHAAALGEDVDFH